MTPLVGLPVYRIAPPRGLHDVAWREIWEARELVGMLAWRDVSVRYRQTLIGVAWVLIQPLATTLVFWAIFGRLARLPSDGVPYPLFTLAGLAGWNYVSHVVSGAAGSLIDNAGLLGKVYFPRIVLPAAVVLAGLLDFAITLTLLFLGLALYGIVPGAQVVWLPLVLVVMVALSLGLGLGLASINAQFRDVRYAIPFALQLWLYASPVAYSSALIPSRHRLFYALNPMVGVLDGLRSCLLGHPLDAAALALSAVVATALLAVGLARFMQTERTLTDFV